MEGIKILYEKIKDYRASKKQSLEKFFANVVEESFNLLEIIHQDYITNLSKLRSFLINESLPPRELIQWLRESGLKLRVKRSYLETIEYELKPEGNDLLSFRDRVKIKGKKDEFEDHLRQYIQSVLEYYLYASYPFDKTFYREYENKLQSILDNVSREPDSLKEFYSDPYMKDMNESLLDLTDKWLPEKWKEASKNYRRLRQYIVK